MHIGPVLIKELINKMWLEISVQIKDLEMRKLEKIVIFADWIRGRDTATALRTKMTGVLSK